MDALVVGLNGALQRRVGFAGKVNLGGVNRAADSSTGVGGKGQGAWIATQQLLSARKPPAETEAGAGEGGKQKLNTKLVQFYGSGDEGSALLGAIRSQCPGADDEALWVQTASKTRICTTLVSADSGEATEIVEPSGVVTAEEVATLLAALEAEKAKHGSARAEEGALGLPGVLVMGSMPPGVPGDAYGRIVSAVGGSATKVVVDSVAGTGPLLAAVRKIEGCSAVLKLNGREVLRMAGEVGPGGSDNDVAVDHSAVAAAAKKLVASFNEDDDDEEVGGGSSSVEFVCWTDGRFPAGALEVSSGRTWSIALPPLPGPVVSPVGAGDAVAGATFVSWLLHNDNKGSDGDSATAGASSGARDGSKSGAGGGAGGGGVKFFGAPWLFRPNDKSSAKEGGGGKGTVGNAPPPVAAFAVGVAVGAASCLTGENSRFDLAIAQELYAGATVKEEAQLQ